MSNITKLTLSEVVTGINKALDTYVDEELTRNTLDQIQLEVLGVLRQCEIVEDPFVMSVDVRKSNEHRYTIIISGTNQETRNILEYIYDQCSEN